MRRSAADAQAVLVHLGHRVDALDALISALGADKALIGSGYFDRIVTLDDIFGLQR